MFANKSKWDSLILKAGLIDFDLGLIVFRFVSPRTHSLQDLDFSLTMTPFDTLGKQAC